MGPNALSAAASNSVTPTGGMDGFGGIVGISAGGAGMKNKP